MKANPRLIKELRASQATQWQTKAAFILLKVNGIENAIEYAKGLKGINERNAASNQKAFQYEDDATRIYSLG